MIVARLSYGVFAIVAGVAVLVDVQQYMLNRDLSRLDASLHTLEAKQEQLNTSLDSLADASLVLPLSLDASTPR